MAYCCACLQRQNARAARFVPLADRLVGEEDERESDSASFCTHFYFTGWGKQRFAQKRIGAGRDGAGRLPEESRRDQSSTQRKVGGDLDQRNGVLARLTRYER